MDLVDILVDILELEGKLFFYYYYYFKNIENKYFIIHSFWNLGPYEGGKPDATFSLKDEDFVKLAMGKLNPQMAFMRCKTLDVL